MRQVRVRIQMSLGLPDLVEDKQCRVLFVAQHVVLDATGFGATWFDISTEQRFEGRGFFRAGLGLQDEAMQFAHQVFLESQNRHKLMAIIACRFVRIGQMNFAE